jgi:hypothetical protein
MAQGPISVTKSIDTVNSLLARVHMLTENEVLVGVPQAQGARQQGVATNAMLAYVHEFGSPLRNIPPRPFLIPGIRKVSDQITARLVQAGRDVTTGRLRDPMVALNQVGMLARNSVVNEITDPAPPFVPLKPATVRARLRKTAAGRRKLRTLGKLRAATGWSGAQSNQALTEWAEAGNIHPLIDTGQLRAAITYVIRPQRSVGWARTTRTKTQVILAHNVSEQRYR